MSSYEEFFKRQSEYLKKRDEEYSANLRKRHEQEMAQSSRSSSSSSSYSYSGGGGTPIPTSRLIAIFLVVALVVVGVIVGINYNSYYKGEWTSATADKQSGRSAADYQNYLLSLDTEYKYWNIAYEKAPATLWNYLLGFVNLDKAEGYSLGGYNVEGGNVYDYRFEGDDAGTGIPNGWYTLTKLDGINVLIDEDNETIYKEGTEFYDTYAPKLKALAHDSALDAILEKTKDGEHAMSGSNDSWMEFIRKDNTMVYSYMLSDDETKISGDKFRAITTHPEEKTEERWIFSYGDSEYVPDDWDGFVYADDNAFNTDDELGKLMKKSFDDYGGVAFYKNDEVVLGFNVEYFPDGYAFEVAIVEEGYERGFEEDMVYRVNTTEKTLTKYVDDYGDLVDGTDMPLSEHRDKYDFLLSIVPHTYIRSIIDMDKAEKRKESVGLVTVYEMKDENGKVTADMKLMFGKIGEVNHYTGENEYVQIELEY